MKYKYNYGITVGDWSGNGHDRAINYYFKTNKLSAEILTAFEKAQELSGVSFDEVLSDYGDRKLTAKHIKSLTDLGIDFHFTDKYKNGSVDIYPDETFHLIMKMIQNRLPDMVYEVVEPEIIIKGVGYGVFD